ncbi:MAG: alpha/beta hydrolase [Labilithrix sp.]|nr:alpha/beta hydrolase [Labilithrix sp.]MCW5811493.1 alpha/beta hydrolase [Labilithrix sp.]
MSPRALVMLLACAACAACVVCAACATQPAGPARSAAEVEFAETQGGGAISGATSHAAIPYAASSPTQKLDLFVPQNGRKPYPVVVRFHGGAFHTGSARMVELGPAAEAVVAAGYVFAAVNYRLAPEAPFPAAARDAKAAVRFLRANAERWDLDPERFAAWGDSAGGWLAVMLGVTGDQPTAFDDPSLGNAHVSAAVQAVVDWYGPTDFAQMDAQHAAHPPVACPETYERHSGPSTAESTWVCGDRWLDLGDPACVAATRAANLIGYVETARVLPPFMIAHGADDCTVPWSQSVALAEALRKREAEVTYTKVPRARHADPHIEASETPRALELLAKTFPPPG